MSPPLTRTAGGSVLHHCGRVTCIEVAIRTQGTGTASIPSHSLDILSPCPGSMGSYCFKSALQGMIHTHLNLPILNVQFNEF